MSLHHSISAGFHESIVITEILKSFQDNHTNIACVLFGSLCTAPLCWCLLNFLFNELFMVILPCCFPVSFFFTSCHSEISHAVMELLAISSWTIYLLDLWFWVTVWLSSPVWGNSFVLVYNWLPSHIIWLKSISPEVLCFLAFFTGYNRYFHSFCSTAFMKWSYKWKMSFWHHYDLS